MTGVLENTYRHINIALVNEMARFCHDLNIDLWEVIGAASAKPFVFQSFRYGSSVGGRCIPIDPNYLSHYVRAKPGYPFRCVELAEEINSMPAYLGRRVQDLLNRDSNAVRGAYVVAGHDLASESDLYGAVANADACVLHQNDRKDDADELALGAGTREALTCH
jgi:UDP-N-acetyl-D-mannosaminuronate dehydrogenase